LNFDKKIEFVKSSLEERCQISMKARIDEKLIDKIVKSSCLIVDSLKDGHKIIVFGNGGSSSDSQHFVAELVGHFRITRRALPAIALTTNTSIITSVSNDDSFVEVFKRQLEALANWGDVVIGISTSGKSQNVLRAMRATESMNVKTIGLTGEDGGDLASLVDININVPSNRTARIQEEHIAILHIIADIVERDLFE
jgi:D-sedoheptulose 7-phosphate isomerase